MIEPNRDGDVWVVAEQTDGVLHDVGLELLSKGRELADALGVRLSAVVLGERARAPILPASRILGMSARLRVLSLGGWCVFTTRTDCL